MRLPALFPALAAMACIVFWALLDSHDQQLEMGFPMPATGVSLMAVRKALFIMLSDATSFKSYIFVCVCIYICIYIYIIYMCVCAYIM